MKVTVVNTLAPYESKTFPNAYGITHFEDTKQMRIFENVVIDDEEMILQHDYPDRYLFMIET